MMQNAKIIPRWEWRTFCKKLGEHEKNIKKYDLTSQRESSEIYILSKKNDNNIKIRNGKLNIKSLLNISNDNLEQWTVTLKTDFPISLDKLKMVYNAFNLPLLNRKKTEYSLNEFLDILIKSEKNLQIIYVSKIRYGYMIDDCMVEIADVKFNDLVLKTVAVEHINPKLVINVVKKFGLDKFENINYMNAFRINLK